MIYTPKAGDQVTWGGIGPYTVAAVGKWYALVVAENGMEYPAAIVNLVPIPDTVTITISRATAEGVVRDLPEASDDFAFGRVALACRAALEVA